MKIRYTLSEAELQRAVVAWIESESTYAPQDIDSPAVTIERDPQTGAYTATVEVVEV